MKKYSIFTGETFAHRHLGLRREEQQTMLKTIGCESLDELIDQTIPSSIRREGSLDLPKAKTEGEYLRHIKKISLQNKIYRNYIGLGYHHCLVPNAIKRNVFENPGWYTQYTPYQAEISQGRLEALLNFQTVVSDLTGFEIANASLLDEATAAAEAMLMFWNNLKKGEAHRNVFLVDEHTLPQNLAVIETRAEPLGIEVKVCNVYKESLADNVFGMLFQYPNAEGRLQNPEQAIAKAKSLNIGVVLACDILSLCVLKSPAELGADCAVGNSQRFGVPLGYGGPHAAFFATTDAFKRKIPGRIIGMSIDANEKPALRMALQTREQHIKRDKATSNICTAQALLAIMASFYCVYHGPEGLRKIAESVHAKTVALSKALKDEGIDNQNELYFDCLRIVGLDVDPIKKRAEEKRINFFYNNESIQISLDEATLLEDLEDIFWVLTGKDAPAFSTETDPQISKDLVRSSNYLQHPTFNRFHSETELMRYIKRLENKDLSLTSSMISLGSCTMKLNAATQLMPLSWAHFADIHPFVPMEQAQGYLTMIKRLEDHLCRITDFTACSLQPNSGAQGEYAGLMVIRAYHHSKNDGQRNIALIPSSAHGTNPASAVMAGMKVVVVKSMEDGTIDLVDLQEKAELHSENLAALMITYPSTHGVFEPGVKQICKIIHDNGGLVYMDGANMNAQVGLTSPGLIGADVCHLNLHKTFAIPHGGGGPGMGPICVNDKLKDFLPKHPLVETGGKQAIKAVNAAPFGSSSILLISYAYIEMLGREFCQRSTEVAILNANYMKARLDGHYPILYLGENGRVAHEFIVDFRPFKKSCGLEVEDVAKRLMDYGFHAPTMSFPVAGTMMIEPTESESLEELDRFCDAMIQIRMEIQDIEDGKINHKDSALANAPHTQEVMAADEWNQAYSREQAAFPLAFVRANKFWPSVGRVNNSFGDRNLICTCPPMEAYALEEA